jgi:hypothetical protein
MVIYDLSWPAQGTDFDHVREGPSRHFLRANRDVFVWQHVNSHSSSKKLTKLSARFISPLPIDLQSPISTSSNTQITSSRLVF